MRSLGLGLILVTLAAPGCADLKRLAGIERSTKKTESTTGELNENTKDMKTSIDQVDGNTKAMKGQLDQTKRELQDANARLDETNASLDETNRKLEETKAKLDDLTATMARSNAGIEVLVDNTGHTYIDLRQGEALATRSRQLETLERTDALESKIAEAWKYFAAFEFQMWKGVGEDTTERRAELFREALDEFLRDVERYLPPERERDASPLSNAADARNLYAVATAMEAYNSLQVAAVERVAGTATTSMLDLLHAGLRAGVALERGERRMADLLPWERIVLENEDAARYLLRVRMNFLPAVPLAQFTEVERGGVTKLLELLRLGFTRWTADLTPLGNVRIETMASWLDKGEAERTFLREGGTMAVYDAKLRQAYGNMRLQDDASGERVYLEDRAAVKVRFTKAVALLVGDR